MKKAKMKLFLILVLMTMITSTSLLAAASTATETLSAVSFTISSTSESGYTAEGAIQFSFTSDDTNFTTLKFHCYIILNGYSAVLESKTLTHSSYLNGSTITKTTVLYMDHTAAAWKYVDKDDTLILYIKAYNDSISSSNLLATATARDTYPFVTSTDESGSTGSTASTTVAIASLAVVIAIVSAVGVIYIWKGSQGAFEGSVFDAPFSHFRNESTRGQIVMGGKKDRKGKRYGGKTFYAVRDKNGQFTDIQNINRSIRADARHDANPKIGSKDSKIPNKPGKGHLGDYKKR
ncbi:MAG: hypothetical protein ACFFD4_02585 [Candidatus Odinarchaeota archaeon]